MDVTSLMRRSALFNADRTAIVAGEHRLTFAQAWQRGCRMANALRSLGVTPGDRVGVLEDNSVEAADMFIGAGIAGAVRVPLYPRNSVEAHQHMLGHTDCKVLVVSANHAADVTGIDQSVPSLEHMVVRDDGYEDWLASFSDEDPMIECGPDDNYIIRHTGGTTGMSKGVAYTHKTWLDAGRDWFYLLPPVLPGDACMHIGPISHGSGYLFLPTFLGMAKVVVLAAQPLGQFRQFSAGDAVFARDGLDGIEALFDPVAPRRVHVERLAVAAQGIGGLCKLDTGAS